MLKFIDVAYRVRSTLGIFYVYIEIYFSSELLTKSSINIQQKAHKYKHLQHFLTKISTLVKNFLTTPSA